MTFLKKLGQVLLKIVGIALQIEPLAAPFIGSASVKAAGVINDLTAIGQVVVQAEALIQGTGTGATKLAAASPLVANIIKTSELMIGKKVKDEAAFVKACQEITGGVADLLNSLDESTIKA